MQTVPAAKLLMIAKTL